VLFKRKHHYKRIRDDKVAAIQGDARGNITQKIIDDKVVAIRGDSKGNITIKELDMIK